jgi:hypothetical protein
MGTTFTVAVMLVPLARETPCPSAPLYSPDSSFAGPTHAEYLTDIFGNEITAPDGPIVVEGVRT